MTPLTQQLAVFVQAIEEEALRLRGDPATWTVTNLVAVRAANILDHLAVLREKVRQHDATCHADTAEARLMRLVDRLEKIAGAAPSYYVFRAEIR